MTDIKATVRHILTQHGRLPADVTTIDDDDNLYDAGLTSLATVGVMLAPRESPGRGVLRVDAGPQDLPEHRGHRRGGGRTAFGGRSRGGLTMSDPAHRALGREGDFDSLLGRVHAIGREVLAAHAGDVDRDARFPREALTALCGRELLGALVPRDLGGMGLTVSQVARVCDALGQYCGSSAMVFAMHQIQVACVVHHARQSAYFRAYLGRLVAEQRLIASATTEVGVGGDLRSSSSPCTLTATRSG